MTDFSPDIIAQLAHTILTLDCKNNRILVAIAGAPASGKSTLSEQLQSKLGDTTIVVPMDGFHLDNAVLKTQNLLGRKGAPQTFDVHGFKDLLFRFQKNEDVYFPVFDRAQDLSIMAAGHVSQKHKIILIEGNYLLLKQSVWLDLNDLFDYRIFLNVKRDKLIERLRQRWFNFGLTPDVIEHKVFHNDLPNIDMTLQSIGKFDIKISN